MALVVTGKNELEICEKFTTGLNNCTKWLSDHSLSLTVKKTKLMFIGTGSKLTNISYWLINFWQGTSHYSSWVQISWCFARWQTEIWQTCGLYPIEGHSKNENSSSHKIIYFKKHGIIYLYTSLIQPVSEYIDFVYDPMNKGDCNKLQVLQNKCLGICLLRGTTTSRTDRFAEANIDTLSVARTKHTCKIVYQGINGLSTNFVNNAFTMENEIHDVTTRSSKRDCLYVPKTRLECSQGNIRVRGALAYNKLPTDLRQIASFEESKCNLKQQNY